MKYSLSLSTLCLILAAPSVHACSCGPPPKPKEALEQAHAVFVAKVTKIDRSPPNGTVVTMEISTTWKGTKGKTVNVYTGNGGCDNEYVFTLNKSYLVYARQPERDGKKLPHFSTDSCTRTRPLEKAKDDIDALGLAKMPPG